MAGGRYNEIQGVSTCDIYGKVDFEGTSQNKGSTFLSSTLTKESPSKVVCVLSATLPSLNVDRSGLVKQEVPGGWDQCWNTQAPQCVRTAGTTGSHH